jgi:hypothetical protein
MLVGLLGLETDEVNVAVESCIMMSLMIPSLSQENLVLRNEEEWDASCIVVGRDEN